MTREEMDEIRHLFQVMIEAVYTELATIIEGQRMLYERLTSFEQNVQQQLRELQRGQLALTASHHALSDKVDRLAESVDHVVASNASPDFGR